MLKQVSGRAAETVVQWLGWADEDYLSARALLLSGYVVQGTAFANTGIEKYFKAVLTHVGVRFGKTHDVSHLYSVLTTATGKKLNLNAEFLSVLGKAYMLRYPDSLPLGFNIGLYGAKILTETDTSVYAI